MKISISDRLITAFLMFITLVASVAISLSQFSTPIIPSTGLVRYPETECNFGIVASIADTPAIRNFFWLFGNQSISYQTLLPSEVTDLGDIDPFEGLVVWTRNGGYNATCIREFARTRIVISHIRDFCLILYPVLRQSMRLASAGTVTYVADWGNFRSGDRVEMKNETAGTYQLTSALASGFSGFANVTTIARYDTGNIASFYMHGAQSMSGFYVMDLHATTPETEWVGIWHVFPAVKMVKDFPTGKYARWFAEGIDHWTYDQVMAWLRSWVRSTPRGMSASLIRIGKSVLGRDINATRLGNGSRYIVIDAAIHGGEKNPVASVLRLLEVIQEDFEAGGYWKKRLNEVSLIVIPILNPDGYVKGTRDNARGKDLNRQFPPGGTTTEPEAWALRWLWGNYTTIVYVTLHEGRNWWPSDYFYTVNFTQSFVDIKYFAKQNSHWTADDFKALHHWGYYAEEQWVSSPVDIGEVKRFHQRSGSVGQSDIGASYLQNISGYLAESFVWSSPYGGYKARQMLWAMDYYITTILGMITHLDWLRKDNFLAVTQGRILSFTWTAGTLRMQIDTSTLAQSASCTTSIDVGFRTRPSHVLIDSVEKTEGNGWTYANGIITTSVAKSKIQVSW